MVAFFTLKLSFQRILSFRRMEESKKTIQLNNFNMKTHFLLFVLIILVSCKSEKEEQSKTLKTGTYKALLKVNDSVNMPFNFKVISEKSLQIFNGDEMIEVDEITYRNDSVFIKTPVLFVIRLIIFVA